MIQDDTLISNSYPTHHMLKRSRTRHFLNAFERAEVWIKPRVLNVLNETHPKNAYIGGRLCKTYRLFRKPFRPKIKI